MIERDSLMAALAILIGIWIGYWALTKDVSKVKSHLVGYVARQFGPRAARVFVFLLGAAFCSLGVAIAWQSQ